MFRNHNLKFNFSRLYGKEDMAYYVHAGEVHIGHVEKDGKAAWRTFDVHGIEHSTRVGQGARQAAAEVLAHRAGLLDGNYNVV